MVVKSGTERQFAIKGQLPGTHGTGGTYGKLVEFDKFSFPDGMKHYDNRQAFNGQVGPNRYEADIINGAELSFSKRLNIDTDGIILTCGLGVLADALVETGVYTHTATQLAAVDQFTGNFAVMDYRTSLLVWELLGLKLDKFSIKAAGMDGLSPVILSGNAIGLSAKQGATWAGGYTASPHHDLYWSDCSLAYNAGGLTYFRDFEFSQDGGLNKEWRAGSKNMAEGIRTKLDVGIKFSCISR